MSVFLTPDLKPIFGGTYFPAKERYGMSSFQTLLQNVSAAWKNKRTKVIEQVSLAITKVPNVHTFVE